MKPKFKKFTVVATLVVIVLGAIGYQALAAALQAGQPTAVVTVNLGTVMEKLDQWADAAGRLRALRDDLSSQQQKRSGELEAMQQEARKLQESVASADAAAKPALEKQLQEVQERTALATLDFQAWMNFSAEKADIESALATQELYRSVKAAVSQMATTNRYDVVLVDDSQGELLMNSDSRMSRLQQIQQQIGSRRILYANPVIDITDDLIQRMNNAYKAAGPKAQ